jgi:long-chain fatty acid transport protein
MIISGGLAYAGVEKLLLAADVRYIDFENTTGFDVTGFGPQGQVLGFGWSSIVVVAIGAQYEVAPGLPVRLGYSFNDNPIDTDGAFFNTPAPAIIEQHVSGGLSYDISEKITASLAVQLGLSNEVAGSWKTINQANGATVSIPNTSVTNKLSTMTVIGGVHIRL